MSDSDVFKWLLTSIVPFLLGVLWQSWRASSSEIASQLNDLLKDLRQLEELTTEYWTSDQSSDPKNAGREARIRGLTFVLASYEGQAREVFGRNCDKYVNLMDTLIEAATGGGFETTGREADYERAVKAQAVSAEIGQIARSARRKSASMAFAGMHALKSSVSWILAAEARSNHVIERCSAVTFRCARRAIKWIFRH